MTRPLRLVIGGGGTGGHTVPALAVLDALRAHTAVEVLWIGSRRGVERHFAEQNKIPFRWIPTGKLRRDPTPRTLLDLAAVPLGIVAAATLLRTFRPDVVFGTGGYVSVPVVIAAWLNRVPIVIHEQTAIPGLATRIAAQFADAVAISFEATRSRLRHRRSSLVHTGLPIRRELFRGNAQRALAHFGFTEDLPLVYVTGGVLGAHALNQVIAAALPHLLKCVQVLHQCGPARINGDFPRLVEQRSMLPSPLQKRYAIVEFLTEELPDVYAAADLVISRAGASTVAELAALGKPAILVPLPGARGDEQTANARLLSDLGSAILLPQRDLTPQRIVALVERLVANREALVAMGQRGRVLAVPDAAERLANLILATAHFRSAANAPPVPRAH